MSSFALVAPEPSKSQGLCVTLHQMHRVATVVLSRGTERSSRKWLCTQLRRHRRAFLLIRQGSSRGDAQRSACGRHPRSLPHRARKQRESGRVPVLVQITRTNNRVQNAVKVCNRGPGPICFRIQGSWSKCSKSSILQTLTATSTPLFVLVICTHPLAKMQGGLFCNL